MQIHELNSYNGNVNEAYLLVDNGTDTGKILTNKLLENVNNEIQDANNRIDNLISGVTVDSEVIDARVGENGKTYSSLGAAIRGQVSSINKKINPLYIKTDNLLDFGYIGNTWEQGSPGNSNPYQCKSKAIDVSAHIGEKIYGVVNRTLMQETAAISTYTVSLYVVSFDSNDTKIAETNLSNSSGETTGSYTIPNNCSYIKFYLSTGVWGNSLTPTILDNAVEAFAYAGFVTKTKNEVEANYIPVIESSEMVYIKNSVDTLNDNALVYDRDQKITLTGTAGLVSKTGTINTGDARFIHYIENVTAGEVYEVQTFEQADPNYPFIVFYDGADNIVGFVESGNAGLHTKEVRIPTGISKMSVNGYNAATTPTIVYLLALVRTKDYINEYLSENYWKGKKIVWFGTSIPAGVVNAGESGGNGAYPTRIGKMLGATVYNESVGSSCARAGSYHAIADNDPMGWSGMGAISVMLSLSLSSAEKQDIIDNWDSTWKYIIGDPDSYDPTKIATYLSSSWDQNLAKYLTGGSVGQCDLYVFDHGYNDGVSTYGFSDLNEEPATQDDRTYWRGAMNFLIGKILADNPKAKILIIGHYNYGADAFSRGANWSGKYVCDAQKDYAESWGMTCVETWKLLGLSMNNIDVNGTPTPVIFARYPDHLHPASDATGYELQRYAEALEPYIRITTGS